MHISAVVFKRQFDHFNNQILEEDGQPFRSFQEGTPGKWEGGKEDIWHEAQKQLDCSTWTAKEIGTGQILQRVRSAIEINESKTLRNYLVAWDERRGPDSRSHRALVEASPTETKTLEQWFFDFYKGNASDPQAAFETLVELVGQRYDLVAYVFFLKNRRKYLPIGTTTFDTAFSMLGLDLVTARKCSWENYSQFLAAISEVRRLLVEVAGLSDATLLDGHSFCWMLARLETPPPAAGVVPAPQPLSTLTAAEVNSLNEPTTFNVVTEDDFIRREANQRRLGRLAQDTALESEKNRLIEAGHADPSSVVRPVWDEPARGYDILSAEIDGSPRHIEVKAARQSSGGTLSFLLSSNEFEKSHSLPNYWFYLVIKADSDSPKILSIPGKDVLKKYLTAKTFEASFSAKSD